MHSQSSGRSQAKRLVADHLESLGRSGVTHLGKSPAHGTKRASTSTAAEQSEPGTANRSPRGGSDAAAPGEASDRSHGSAGPAKAAGKPLFAESLDRSARSPAECTADLAILQQEVAGCTRCGLLASTRTQTVFGVGSPQPRLCFLGEAPGADEDRLGEPFVGRAGQLLTKIIEACTLTREDVYILNVLKCRPPDNRNPLPDEVANCRGYFERQLEILRPEFLCCLGAVAAQAILETTSPIGRLRGRFHDYRGIQVLCTYHPSYLLRNPAAKKDVWEDMKILMAAMGISLPSR